MTNIMLQHALEIIKQIESKMEMLMISHQIEIKLKDLLIETLRDENNKLKNK